MPNYTVIHYNQDAERIISLGACRIDIVNSHSLFYYSNIDYQAYRIFSEVSNVNIEPGIITVYYVNGSYVVITQKND